LLAAEALAMTLAAFALKLPELPLLAQFYGLLVPSAIEFAAPETNTRLAALALATQSGFLLQLGWRRETRFLQPGAWLAAVLAVALLVAIAFVADRRCGAANWIAPRPTATYFSALALLMLAATTWSITSREVFPLALALEAVALTASIYALRLRELTLLGQGF